MKRGNLFRCDYCGRFVSYADLEAGKAKAFTRDTWDYGTDNHKEEPVCYHVACEETSGANLMGAK